MTDDIVAQCRAAVSQLATAIVLRDPSALRYLSGQAAFGGTLPASQLMLSSAYLVGDVLGSGLGTALGRRPAHAEIMQAWHQAAGQARERLASSLHALAEGQPEGEARAMIAHSASTMDAGLVTALPLLTAFLSGDMAEYERGAAEAAAGKQLTTAVLATQLVIRDLFETAVNTSVGGAAADEEVQREWETFMARRAASNRRV